MDDHERFPRPKSSRLPSYDYSLTGSYFITVCAHEKACIFGRILDGKMELSGLGRIVEAEWLEIPKHRPLISLLEYAVMPNHFHAVLRILEDESELQNQIMTHTPPSFDGDINKLAPGSLSADREILQGRRYEAGERGTRVFAASLATEFLGTRHSQRARTSSYPAIRHQQCVAVGLGLREPVVAQLAVPLNSSTRIAARARLAMRGQSGSCTACCAA